MKATDTLKEEHRVIERVLVALDKAAKFAAQNKPVGAEFFIRAAEFNQAFTDSRHQRKEEEILFKILADNGVQVEGGPIGTLLSEHERCRDFMRSMRGAAEAWAAGDLESRAEVIWAASSYATLLRQHLEKENGWLFALAEQTIPADEQEKMAAAFEGIEQAGGQGASPEQLAETAEALSQEAAAWR